MELIICPQCGKEISDQAGKCVHCGCDLNRLPKVQVQQLDVPDSEENTIEKKSNKKWIIIAVIVLILATVVGVGYWFISREIKYKAGVEALSESNYDDGRNILIALNGYKDSANLIENSYYDEAKQYFDSGDYEKSISVITDHANTDESNELLTEAKKYHRYSEDKEKLYDAYSKAKWLGLTTLSDDETRLIIRQDGVDNAGLAGASVRLVFDELNIPVSTLFDMLNVTTALYGGSGTERSDDYIIDWSYFDGLTVEISIKAIDQF